jgi:hypothetical protein
MSLKGMGDIERGAIPDPHYSSLHKIAEGLGVSVGELLEEPTLAGKAAAPPPEGAAAGLEARDMAEQDLAAALLGRVQKALADRWLRWTQEAPPNTAAEVRAFADGVAVVLDTPGLREAARTADAAVDYSVSTMWLRKLREAAVSLENADSAEERREALRKTEEAAGTQA